MEKIEKVDHKTKKRGFGKIRDFFDSYYKLAQLKGVKKVSQVSARATIGVFSFCFLLMGLAFFGVAIALLIGEAINYPFVGFLIVGVLFLLVILLIRVFYKKILNYLLDFFVNIIFRE